METAQEQVTVLVVDDDSSVRRGVARLARSAGFSTRTYGSPDEFLKQPLPPGPACLVLDVCMDGLDGLGVQQALQQNQRRIPIVFLSGHGSVQTVAKAIKGGAEDFLEKPFQPKALMDAIRLAVEHDRRDAAEREGRDELTQCYKELTAREREVMSLVVRGRPNKQIAADLGISEKTVKVHRGRVMEKMAVESLAELVRLADRIVYPPLEHAEIPRPELADA